MDIEHNPNGSYGAVEGIMSPDGRILGKMGHSESVTTRAMKNDAGRKRIRGYSCPAWVFRMIN